MSSHRSTTGTRERILDAARKLLEAEPWAGLGLAAVAREAGVSRQAIYLHFESRAALLLALVERVDEVEGLAALVEWVDSAQSGEEELDRRVHLNVVYEPRIRAIAMAHDAARRQDPELEAAWQDRMRRRRAACRRLVDRLHDEGRLAKGVDCGDAAELMWALLGPRVHEDLVGDCGWTPTRYEIHMRSLLRRALLDGE